MNGTGKHLMIECYNCDAVKLDDEEFIYKFLEEMPNRINMQKISKPAVIRHSGSGWDPGGISGFIMFAESHLSIHTIPKARFFAADIYSFNEFDVDVAEEFLRRTFGAKASETHLVERGRKFNKKKLQYEP